MFSAWVALTSLIAGLVASVSGFGIGSLLTPLLSLKMGTKVAVAAVAVPHFVGTFVRFWMLKSYIDRRVLMRFGMMSAAGGLVGALLHTWLATSALTLVFGGLLIFSGAMGLTGFSERLRFGSASAWIAGGLSGTLGGLVGNQGGIRSAALIGFDIPKEAFVATATAVGVIVDIARLPVYLVTDGRAVLQEWKVLLASVFGVVIGTFLGKSLLKRLPEKIFRRAVCVLVLLLGIFMLGKGLQN